MLFSFIQVFTPHMKNVVSVSKLTLVLSCRGNPQLAVHMVKTLFCSCKLVCKVGALVVLYYEVLCIYRNESSVSFKISCPRSYIKNMFKILLLEIKDFSKEKGVLCDIYTLGILRLLFMLTSCKYVLEMTAISLWLFLCLPMNSSS